jgi:hypothetical protein
VLPGLAFGLVRVAGVVSAAWGGAGRGGPHGSVTRRRIQQPYTKPESSI